MTQRRRNKERGLLEPKPPTLPEGGRQIGPLRSARVVGKWIRTEEKHRPEGFFASDVYKNALALIQDALGYADEVFRPDEWDFPKVATAAHLTERQTQAVDLHLDGHSNLHIAGVMEITEGVVRQHLKAGLLKLKTLDTTTPSVVSK